MAQLPVGSNLYGNGSDGALTINSNTTDAPIDSTAAGASGQKEITATNASFTTGQIILIIQTTNTGLGAWELNEIASYTEGTITCTNNLANTYTHAGNSKAQVLVVEQHDNITVDSAKTLTAKAWTNVGEVGGVLALMASGTMDINGTITASGKGFVGGAGGVANPQSGTAGEGEVAAVTGGGGGLGDNNNSKGGGGGGHTNVGTAGVSGGGTGGTASSGDSEDLTTLVFGGGGGGGGNDDGTSAGTGGNGGGFIFLIGKTISIDNSTGSVVVDGIVGGNGGGSGGEDSGGGGGGAGGSLLIKGETVTYGTDKISSSAGSGGSAFGEGTNGGAGSVGRIRVEYGKTLTGSASDPAASEAQVDDLILSAAGAFLHLI